MFAEYVGRIGFTYHQFTETILASAAHPIYKVDRYFKISILQDLSQ